jgi:hypothetical protein
MLLRKRPLILRTLHSQILRSRFSARPSPDKEKTEWACPTKELEVPASDESLAPTTSTTQSLPSNPIHAQPLLLISKDTNVQSLHWIPPPSESRSARTLQEQRFQEEVDAYHRLPPPPQQVFDSFCPEDRKAERAYMDAVEKTLPPNDLFRIPIMLSRPWFGYVLWGYCAIVGACVVLFGNWDALSEGHPHVFSGVSK